MAEPLTDRDRAWLAAMPRWKILEEYDELAAECVRLTAEASRRSAYTAELEAAAFTRMDEVARLTEQNDLNAESLALTSTALEEEEDKADALAAEVARYRTTLEDADKLTTKPNRPLTNAWYWQTVDSVSEIVRAALAGENTP